LRRLLFCNRNFFLDDSNGAAIANRVLARRLARLGFGVEVLSGTVVDAGQPRDPAEALDERGIPHTAGDGSGVVVGAAGVLMVDPPHLRARVDGVPMTTDGRPIRTSQDPDEAEVAEFLRLFDGTVARFRPDVLVTYGGDPLTMEILRRSRRLGMATVFTLHNFSYRSPGAFVDVDAVLVASRFSASYHRTALGIECTVIPYLIEWERVLIDHSDPDYVTFVNPSAEKGVFVFARIADELGRRRPDIPLLVVESRGTEATLVSCGIDLRDRDNVYLMSQTPDPRDFWRVTRICLMPSLWNENQPLIAIEAMSNGIPVIGSDRGGIPETIGAAGVVEPLPDRLTASTRTLPEAEEVTPWVDAIIRLWDDAALRQEHRERALREVRRWSPEVLEPRYAEFFEGVGRRPASTLDS
jgi:glycosyltransferase involved in cell wall biosynthesis